MVISERGDEEVAVVVVRLHPQLDLVAFSCFLSSLDEVFG